MLDTVKLESPKLEPSVASEISRNLIERQAFRRSTGELLYRITSGSLEGSYDSRVSVRVMHEEWVEETELVPLQRSTKTADGEIVGKNEYAEKKTTRLRSCPPYIIVEGSVHKALLGHNVHGGPEDFHAPCRWFVADVASRLGVSLPDGLLWTVRRVDWAETYGLPYEGCEGFVWAMNQTHYSRRKSARYGSESVTFPGHTTTTNIYHKGPEFSVHDHRRLSEVLASEKVEALQQAANETLRVEVQIKAKKLRYKTRKQKETGEEQKLPTVEELSVDKIRRYHVEDISRILREGEKQLKTVRKTREVRDRLYSIYSRQQAGVLFGTWMQLCTMGEPEVRDSMKNRIRTFYRHRKLLRDAGISWLGSDVVVLEDSLLPSDFVPLPTDPRRISGESPEVAKKLAPYRVA